MTKEIEQKLIFSLKIKGTDLTASFDFEPALVGAEDFKKLSKEEKYIQNQCAKIMNYVMEAMKKDKE